MNRRILVSTLLVATTLASVVRAQHPETLGYDVDRGYEWVAASRVLNADGSLNDQPMHEWLREGVDWQLKHSKVDHGSREGRIPPPESCATRLSYVSSPPTEVAGGLFDTTLLLSDVAVTASLEEAIPGFSAHGNPVVLFVMSDVVPLRPGSRLANYLLIPFDRLVVNGRVFCAINPNHQWWPDAEHPVPGDRMVVIGASSNDGVVRMNTWQYTGTVARVREGAPLLWGFSVRRGTGPKTFSGLEARIGQAVSGGLFDFAADLALQEYNSEGRREFGELWLNLHGEGCRVQSVETGKRGVRFQRLCLEDTPP